MKMTSHVGSQNLLSICYVPCAMLGIKHREVLVKSNDWSQRGLRLAKKAN